jgi:hypothetical protein
MMEKRVFGEERNEARKRAGLTQQELEEAR